MRKSAQITNSLVKAIEQRRAQDVRAVLKDISTEQYQGAINTPRVAKALMKNFDVAVANILFKNGFSAWSCVSRRYSPQKDVFTSNLLECPSRNFWIYICTPGRIKKSDLSSLANQSLLEFFIYIR